MKTLVTNINTYLLTLVVAMIGYVLASIVPAIGHIQKDVYDVKVDVALNKERIGYTIKQLEKLDGRVERIESFVFSKRGSQFPHRKN